MSWLLVEEQKIDTWQFLQSIKSLIYVSSTNIITTLLVTVSEIWGFPYLSPFQMAIWNYNSCDLF